MMDTGTSNTSLSTSARLLCYLGPPATILLTALSSPRTALLTPFAYIPTALGYQAWKRANLADPEPRAKLESLIWTYLTTGTVGMAGVIGTQIAILAATTRILFPDRTTRKAFMNEFARATIQGLSSEEMAARVAFSSSWQNWVLNVVVSFGVAAITEELLKLSPLLYFKRKEKRDGQVLGRRAYLEYAVATALSFGLNEGIGFLAVACESANETGWLLARTVAERLIAGTAAHLLYATLTGLRATRKVVYEARMSWWRVIAPSVFFHGLGNTFVFSLSTLEGNVGWVHPTGLWTQVALYATYFGVNGCAAWLVRKEWRAVRALEVKDEAKRS